LLLEEDSLAVELLPQPPLDEGDWLSVVLLPQPVLDEEGWLLWPPQPPLESLPSQPEDVLV
jgi:hypothetical protein